MEIRVIIEHCLCGDKLTLLSATDNQHIPHRFCAKCGAEVRIEIGIFKKEPYNDMEPSMPGLLDH